MVSLDIADVVRDVSATRRQPSTSMVLRLLQEPWPVHDHPDLGSRRGLDQLADEESGAMTRWQEVAAEQTRRLRREAPREQSLRRAGHLFDPRVVSPFDTQGLAAPAVTNDIAFFVAFCALPICSRDLLARREHGRL